MIDNQLERLQPDTDETTDGRFFYDFNLSPETRQAIPFAVEKIIELDKIRERCLAAKALYHNMSESDQAEYKENYARLLAEYVQRKLDAGSPGMETFRSMNTALELENIIPDKESVIRRTGAQLSTDLAANPESIWQIGGREYLVTRSETEGRNWLYTDIEGVRVFFNRMYMADEGSRLASIDDYTCLIIGVHTELAFDPETNS